MRMRMRNVIALILCASVVSTLASVTAQTPEATLPAFEAPRFTIFPVGDYENPWFEVTIEAGERVTLTAGIRNTGDVPVSVRTYAANATNPPNGGFNAGTDEEEPTGATLWIDYPITTIEMQPDDEQQLDFTVTVPANTPPGEYVAGLVVQTAESIEIPGSETFRQIIRNTVSVDITVPGEMTSGYDLGEPELLPAGNQSALDIPITNTGTARIRPQGEIVITNPEGQAVVTSPVEMGSVYGGNTTSIRIVLPEQLPTGDYLVSVDLTDPATGTTASIEDAPVTLAGTDADEAPTFVVDPVSITPNANPVQFANVAATITNSGQTIPTATVMLNVQRDGEEVESYPLAQNQALPQGSTDFIQRYIPIDGWQPGTYTFQLVIASVSGGTETILATIDVEDEIIVP